MDTTKATSPRCLLAAILLFLATAAQAQKYAGGDISCLPLYEQAGAKYYNHDGKEYGNALTLFKDEGWNAMRVRLFVSPNKTTVGWSAGQNKYVTSTDGNVCQDLEWVKALGKRIKDAGFKLMLDFHYSDTWADPGKQFTPAAWASLDDAALGDTLYNYTARVLKAMKEAGAEPDFVQTGNEISYGMLWGPVNGTLKQCWPSSDNNWSRFTTLLGRAVAATRDACPNAKVILHVERVSTSQQNDNKQYAALKNFFTRMAKANIDYDIIGLSYYPYFHGPLDELDGAISTLESNWPSKKIMVVEAGYPYAWEVGGTTFSYTGTFDYSDEGQKAFTDSLVTMLNKHRNVNGLFWWWPEYNSYNAGLSGWYNAALFDSRNGRATSAASSLRAFTGVSSGITALHQDGKASGDRYYTLQGQASNNPHCGIFIRNGRKIAIKD